MLRRWWCSLVLSLIAVLGRGLPAQFELLADINRQPLANPSSEPAEVVPLGTRLLFTAVSLAGGRELYVSDGSPASTRLVKDIAVGPTPSFPSQLTPVGNRVYFAATEPVHGSELWSSDGTSAGTHLVRDIRPGGVGSDLQGLTALGGLLYFVANTDAFGSEVWKSDGTAAGTVPVADVRPGPGGSGATILGTLGGWLVFAADDGAAGLELWRTDGVATARIADLRSGAAASSPEGFAVLGGAAYFAADDGTGSALWRTDGTTAGTVKVSDVAPEFGRADFARSVTLGGALYFAAAGGGLGTELWKTDGTTTVLVADIETGGRSSAPHAFVSNGSQVFFSAWTTDAGREPWVTDGTAAGTLQLADLRPVDGSDPLGFVALGSTALFTAKAPDGTRGLWRSDGTPQGTTRVGALRTSAVLPGLTRLGNIAFLAADDGTTGQELWYTAGTAATTGLVADVERGEGYTQGADPRELTFFSRETFFSADDGVHGRELWKTDGSREGTRLVADLAPGDSDPDSLTVVGDRLYFVTERSALPKLWKTDGTAAGTVLVATFAAAANPRELTGVRDTLFFSYDDPAVGRELFKADPGTNGVVLVKDLRPGTEWSSPWQLRAFGDRLVFSANDGTHGPELWFSDGTANGTVVLDIVPGPFGVGPSDLFVYDRHLYFVGSGGFERKIWFSDGSVAGSRVTAVSAAVARFITSGGKLFISAQHISGDSMHVTENGAGPLTALAAPVAVQDNHWIAFREKILLAGINSLWESDGTAAGTRQITPLAGNAYPEFVGATANRCAWFVGPAFDGDLWLTDGTARGTRVARPGAKLDPKVMELTFGHMIFTAADALRGRELWRVFPYSTARTLGVGYGRGARQPNLRAEDPVLGTTFHLRGEDAPAPGVGAILFGPPASTPARVIPGMYLYMQAPATLVVFNIATPRWALPVRLPRDPRLAGVTLCAQVILGPTDAVLGLDITNAVHLTYSVHMPEP